ncbi:MAG: tetratricopeptide repeat protein, partial [Verrucomicrobiota bacterium]|nr:tetratricopeptide repeat protein [Verrucomicrobiota bacterium]
EESYRELLGNAHWQVFALTKDEAAKHAAIESWRQLAPETTRDPNKISRVADLFRSRDLSAEALQSYERAVNLAPDLPELRQRWGEYLFQLQRDEEAWNVLRAMVAGDRATAPNFLRLARLQQRRKDVDGALDSVAKGLALEPRDFELLTLQWRLFAETGRWNDAAALFDRLLAAAPSVHSAEQIEEWHVQALRALGRLDEVLEQLGARIRKEPALAEPELRLLLRLALQQGDLTVAREALAEGRQRFPESVSLVRKQVEYERRMGNLDGRVAALQRLIELQPRQKLEWLREIARACQEEGSWDKAHAAAQRVIDESPANADSHLLAAEISFAAQRFDAGVARLREAIKLADNPNAIRLRLARAFLDAGRVEEARQTFDAAFEAESDPKARLALTKQLAEVHLQQGKLDELITRFRQRQRAEEGGWRYALYLAEIFQQMQDYAAAREELSKALGARSRDGNFLRQLVRLSRAEGNTAECVRFTRLLAEVEPSPAHQIELADSLLDHGDVEEALKVLAANEERLLKDPMSWRDVLFKFQSAGSTAQLAEALRAGLERHPGDWRTRLALAEIQIGMGELDSAERLLWEIFGMKEEPGSPSPIPAAATPAAPTASAAPVAATSALLSAKAAYYPAYYASAWNTRSVSKYSARLSRSYRARQSFTEIVSARKSALSRRGSHRFTSGSGTPPPLNTLEEARDTALVYLAMLATQRDRGDAMLTALAPKLAPMPAGERIFAYALVEARQAALREIDHEIKSASGDPDTDAFCVQFLVSHAQGSLSASSLDPVMLARIESFLGREKDPRRAVPQEVTYHSLLLQAGRPEEARKVADRVLARAESLEIDLLPVVFNVAVTSEAFDVAEKLLQRLSEEARKPNQKVLKQQIEWYHFALADGLLKRKVNVERAVKLLADSLKESYPTQLPATLSSVRSMRGSYRSMWREAPGFPYANRYLSDAQLQRLRQIFDRLKAANALRELEVELSGHIQSLPDDQTVYTQLARACFRWWNGQKGDAIRDVHQLARELKDDELRMMVATMLEGAQQPGDALRVLEQMTVAKGDLFIEKQIRILVLARGANDLARAREIAMQLAEQRLNPNDRSALLNVLNELGLKDKARELMSQRTISRPSSQENRLEQQLEQHLSAKNEKEAVTLARAILARDPFLAMRQGR